MPSQTPDLVVALGDLHCNSTVAICAPNGIELDDKGRYRPSRAQKWLWRQWADLWKLVEETKELHKVRTTYTIINGDAADLNYHSGLQLINRENLDSIVQNGIEVLQPARLCSDHLFITRGTKAHVGEAAYLEQQIARSPQVAAERDGNRPTWDHVPLPVYRTRFSFAHHPISVSLRQHTRSAAAERNAVQIMLEYARRGGKPPDIAVRNHIHWLGDSGFTHPVRCVFPGAWQLCTEFGHRKGKGHELADIAAILILVWPDGRTFIDPYLKTPARKRAWRRKE